MSDALAAAVAALQAELQAQRALISGLSTRVGELHALVSSGAGAPPGEAACAALPPPGAAADGLATSAGSDGGAAAATAAAAAAAAKPGAPAALPAAVLPLHAAASPPAAALRLANTAPLLPEYYLREHNGTIAARIVDAAGLPLSVRAIACKPASAGGAPAAAPAASLPDGTVLRVHLEREGGTVRPRGAAAAASGCLRSLVKAHSHSLHLAPRRADALRPRAGRRAGPPAAAVGRGGDGAQRPRHVFGAARHRLDVQPDQEGAGGAGGHRAARAVADARAVGAVPGADEAQPERQKVGAGARGRGAPPAQRRRRRRRGLGRGGGAARPGQPQRAAAARRGHRRLRHAGAPHPRRRGRGAPRARRPGLRVQALARHHGRNRCATEPAK